MILSLKKLLPGIPTEIRIFLVRSLIIFVCWKLLYHLVLYPVRFPDSQLTNITASSVSWLYQNIMHVEGNLEFVPGTLEGINRTTILLDGKPVINIADGCNALELYVVYIGFLFCLRSTLKRQLTFVAIGVSAIFVLNIFRCFVLLWLKYNDNSLFDFAHHYFFYILIYSFIFYLWFLYSKKLKIAD